MNDKLSQYIEMAEAFAAMSYQGVYLLDTDTNKFVYTSDSPILRCGFSKEEMGLIDWKVLAMKIPDDEESLIEDARNKLELVYKGIPIEIRKKFMIYLNFHVRCEGRKRMVCHKLRMLDFDANGLPHLILALVSPSVHEGDAIFFAGTRSEGYIFVFNNENRAWEPVEPVHLSDDEREMLRLTMQGNTLEQMGSIMCKSIETIKFYRRQVFLKLNVKNIAKAIAYAIHYRLI